MAWMTAGETPTAAKLNEAAPGVATGAGKLIVTDGVNSVTERTPDQDVVLTSESTTSTSYTDLSTSGPAVTVTTGTAALVVISCRAWSSNTEGIASMGYVVSGASTVSAATTKGVLVMSSTTGDFVQASFVHYEDGLTGGSNTFTAKYASSSGDTANFSNRRISVIPF